MTVGADEELRLPPGPLWYDEARVGSWYTTAARTITEADVVAFAGLSGDNHEVHTNAELMRASSWGERLVHGALVVSLATGLRSRTGLFDQSVIALAEIRSWRFVAPVLIGDTVRVHAEIAEIRDVGRTDRGLVTERVEVRNQREEIVQHGEFVMMLRRRNTT